MVNTCMKGLFDVIEKIDGSRRKVNRIYHYTSTEVLDSLLTEATFWASNLYYLNDSSEYQTGISFLENIFAEKITGSDDGDMEEKRKLCVECINEIRELDGYTWPGIFSISFSLEEDALNQWLTYAKEGGVCIEFEKNIMMGYSESDPLIIEEEKDGDGILVLRSGNIAKMIYDSGTDKEAKISVKEIIEIIQNMLEGLYGIKPNDYEGFKQNKKNIKFFFTLLASYVKNGKFVIEDEIRMLCPFLETPERKTVAKIFYNKRENGILRPYIKVKFCQGENFISPNPKLPICKIIVGPAGNQDAVFNSIVHRVEYGRTTIWKYGSDCLKKFLSNYLETYLNRIPVGDNHIAEATQCANYIFDRWRERSKHKFSISCEIKNNMFIALIENPDNTSEKNNISESNRIELEDERIQDIDCWLKENFLSKHGVWIKKSKIPFVY